MPKNPVTQKFSFWCCSNASAWPFVSFDWNWTYVLFKFNHWSCWDVIQQTPILYILPNLYSCWTLVIFSTMSNSTKATPVSDPIQVSAAIVLCLKILWNKVLSLRLEMISTLLRAWGNWDGDRRSCTIQPTYDQPWCGSIWPSWLMWTDRSIIDGCNHYPKGLAPFTNTVNYERFVCTGRPRCPGATKLGT